MWKFTWIKGYTFIRKHPTFNLQLLRPDPDMWGLLRPARSLLRCCRCLQVPPGINTRKRSQVWDPIIAGSAKGGILGKQGFAFARCHIPRLHRLFGACLHWKGEQTSQKLILFNPTFWKVSMPEDRRPTFTALLELFSVIDDIGECVTFHSGLEKDLGGGVTIQRVDRNRSKVWR